MSEEEYISVCPACNEGRDVCDKNVVIEDGRFIHAEESKNTNSAILHHKK